MISLPTSIKTKKKSENSAIFEIESLYPGYGITVGNAIRRVLLSSLTGAAVTEVKIKNAPHEFSTMEGIKEDVLHILMNIKQLRFKVFSDGPETATLKVKGEAVVTGKDFEYSSNVILFTIFSMPSFIITNTTNSSTIDTTLCSYRNSLSSLFS